jgi:hypothetical protein
MGAEAAACALRNLLAIRVTLATDGALVILGFWKDRNVKVIEAVKFDFLDFEMAKWIIERHIWERSAGGFYLSRKVESLTQIWLWKLVSKFLL